MPKTTTKAPSRKQPKQSVTIRLNPEQIAALDKLAEEKSLDRTTLIQIAVGALLKQGVAAMLK